MKAKTLTLDDREFCRDYMENGGQPTLNGLPAKIGGFKETFATVGTLDRRGPVHTWSWQAARRIIENRNGAFCS